MSKTKIFDDWSKDELLSECNDLRLPVSRYDSKEVLSLYLQAANDEANKNASHENNVEEDLGDIYIGKRNWFKSAFIKVLTLF
ncbi:MAG TPA: hypothetical protein VMT35_09955 [Ignavibacteriaceae bacterium]|nr:hypothetical protein [Ignavibacteriaceae bacterium]